MGDRSLAMSADAAGLGDGGLTGVPLVSFRKVCKSYDGRTLALSDLDLDIGKGEFVTFLGPSGSGKTTSLMMLAGFEEPTSGDILLSGRSVQRIPPHRRNIGMVFQNYALFPHMTVEQNIGFPLLVRQIDRRIIAEKVGRALELVRLTGLDRRRPTQLSGGQQQRVALARALVFDPDLVLMDEPLGALDKQLRESLQLEIKHIHAGLGVTVVYVTHDQSEALTLSDRIVVFDKGRVQQVDTPLALYERPVNSFVAQFLGESNRIDGVVLALEPPHAIVETAAGTVRALAVGVSRVGEPTTVSVRPENVAVSAEAISAQNRLNATVEETIYHGDHSRVRLRLAGGASFVIKVPPAQRPDRGSTLEIGWQTEHGRALDRLKEGSGIQKLDFGRVRGGIE